MLQFIQYRKRYGPVVILEVPDLAVPAGIHWIKGANRAGKSTLLKSVAGLMNFEGQIRLQQALSIHEHATTFRQQVNFADAEPLFPEFLTGQDLIDLFCEAKKGTPDQIAYWTAHFHMQAYLHELVGTYSSGMLKKLSIALAFIGNARLILLDEPCITLDAEALPTLFTGIAERHRQHGTSFLISSHQPLAIGGINPRTLMVEKGKLFFQA